MNTRITLSSAVFALALGATPLLAQEQAAGSEPAQNAAPAVAQPRLAATHTDWQILCTTLAEGQPETCEMYQLLTDEQNSPMGEISLVALPLGAEFAAGATVTSPLETFLPSGLGFRIGDAEEMRVEQFRVCTAIGCFVRMGLSTDEVNALKAGSTATVMIAPYVAIDQTVEMTVSLSGFTAAYNDLQERLAAAVSAAQAAASE